MKTSVIVTFSFSCLFLLICIAAGAYHEQVLDTSGEILRPGIKYYILPAIIGRGGLTLINPNNTCPLYVVQEKSLYRGKPVIFIPLEGGYENEIITSTPLNINSIVNPLSTPCYKSLLVPWSAAKGKPGVWFVVADDEVNEITQSIFSIDKSGTDSYVLSLCPVICRGCQIKCNKLGLFDEADGGYTHLASNYELEPYKFRFERA